MHEVMSQNRGGGSTVRSVSTVIQKKIKVPAHCVLKYEVVLRTGIVSFWFCGVWCVCVMCNMFVCLCVWCVCVICRCVCVSVVVSVCRCVCISGVVSLCLCDVAMWLCGYVGVWLCGCVVNWHSWSDQYPTRNIT